MRYLGALLLTLLGIGLVLLGLLFMIGSAGRSHRLLIAVVSLAAGGGMAGVGIRLFKSAQVGAPQFIRSTILALAKREDGEVSEAEIAASVPRGDAGAVLQQLCDEGLCQRKVTAEGTFYQFPSLQPRLLVRRCEFCQAELPLAEELEQCPNCGGTIKTQRESRALSGDDHYSMDED